MAIQGLSAERMKLFRIPQSSAGTHSETTETGRSVLLYLFTVWVNDIFQSFIESNRLKTEEKYKSFPFLSLQPADPNCSLFLCQLTFPSKGLRGLQGLAGTHRVLGWRVLPPLQTGQHGEVGTVRQPGEFCGQPGAEQEKERNIR